MYYNIKIKSNGSEFSLESNNKEVTQREMDMYFAHIFDVSESFKSQIKKIEINNANVKSIEEIENYAKSINIQQQKSAEISHLSAYPQPSIQPPIETPLQTTKQNVSEIKITSTPFQPQLQRIKAEQLNLAQTQPLPQINLQNSAQPIKQTIPTPTPIQPNIQIQPQPQQNFEAKPMFTPQNQNMHYEQPSQINYQATKEDVDNLLNSYIESSLEPTMMAKKKPSSRNPYSSKLF